MRQLLAIFFLTIFSFQVLPIKSIGKLLSKGTLTEETQDGNMNDCGCNGKVAKFNDLLLHFNTPRTSASSELLTLKTAVYIHYSDAVLLPDIKDILTPPPDLA